MNKKEAKKLIVKWEKEDAEEEERSGFHRPASARPTLEQLTDKNWNLYENHYHSGDGYWTAYSNGNPVFMNCEHYRGLSIHLLYQKLLEQITDAEARKTIKKLFGFE